MYQAFCRKILSELLSTMFTQAIVSSPSTAIKATTITTMTTTNATCLKRRRATSVLAICLGCLIVAPRPIQAFIDSDILTRLFARDEYTYTADSFSGLCSLNATKSGCVIASGAQVPAGGASQQFLPPSASSLGIFSFQFEPSFSDMVLSFTVEDTSTSDLLIMNAGLYCGYVEGASYMFQELVPLAFEHEGHSRLNQIITKDAIDMYVTCGPSDKAISVTNLAALYTAMRQELVYVYVELRDKTNGAESSIRGQIVLR